MINLTLVKGKVVLDPNIVLFEELKELYDLPRGDAFLKIIYYRHSREAENPFKDLSSLVLEENLMRVIFRKDSWKDINPTKKEVELFERAEKLFIKYNTTPEARLEKSINKKIDEISHMLNDVVPEIEKNFTKSGETKFSTNLNIIINLFTKIETVLKGKSVLQNAIMKQESAGRVRGGGTTSFREMGLLNDKE
jgi:hypothetical protein